MKWGHLYHSGSPWRSGPSQPRFPKRLSINKKLYPPFRKDSLLKGNVHIKSEAKKASSLKLSFSKQASQAWKWDHRFKSLFQRKLENFGPLATLEAIHQRSSLLLSVACVSKFSFPPRIPPKSPSTRTNGTRQSQGKLRRLRVLTAKSRHRHRRLDRPKPAGHVARPRSAPRLPEPPLLRRPRCTHFRSPPCSRRSTGRKMKTRTQGRRAGTTSVFSHWNSACSIATQPAPAASVCDLSLRPSFP